MKKGFSIVLYIVIAVALIWTGIWYANSLIWSTANTGAGTGGTAPSTTTTGNTNSTSTQTMSDGLIIQDTTVGTGTVAQNGDTVTVNYTGTLDNGTVFDSSLNPGRTPFTFTIGSTVPGQSVIQGWNEGVVGMKVGGTRALTIPPALGYGAGGAGSVIPPNATLHFTITLLSVSTSSSQ
ncbi:MAG TPA: FKBP-type peptidyl-prolyl cis-trans isomerase [Candidatus Paceibacterota bacterium]|nr:FKBP-type peptidyl-prolyl cis-trans isomerase [Candidatus Paceibacterota bacterium]